MAELIFTTESFKPNGTPLTGVPMLLDSEMRLIEPVCAWLMNIAMIRGRTRSSETWRTYGEALYDWWQTLEANQWVWDQITPIQAAAYRDRMLHKPSEQTGQPLAPTTINGRVRIIAMFYRWCYARGLVKKVPFGAEEVMVARHRPVGMLVHVDATSGCRPANELTIRHMPMLPRPLAREALCVVLNGMASRDRLIVEWALMTGIRRMEVAGLRVHQLPSDSAHAMPAIKLDPSKGGKSRMIYPPQPLIDRTSAYVREERSVIIRQARRRDGDYRDPGRLFLTEHGDVMTPRRIGSMFTKAAKKAGVIGSFHALRHTFATAMLRLLQRRAEQNPDMNPLLTLQILLGHSAIDTTGIYLRVLATDLTLVEQSIDELYAGLA